MNQLFILGKYGKTPPLTAEALPVIFNFVEPPLLAGILIAVKAGTVAKFPLSICLPTGSSAPSRVKIVTKILQFVEEKLELFVYTVGVS